MIIVRSGGFDTYAQAQRWVDSDIKKPSSKNQEYKIHQDIDGKFRITISIDNKEV